MANPAASCCLLMPFRNEATALQAVLASLAAQDVDWSTLRFVGIDSASTDGSGEIAASWIAAHGIRGHVVRVEEPGISRALNAGLACTAPDEAVVRLDAHTTYARDYLGTLLEALGRCGDEVWWIGSRPTEVRADGRGTALVRALMTNPMGLGGAAWRHATQARRVDSVYLGIFRPGVLARVGGFEERWAANEDAELGARIRAAGGEVWSVPARCTYHVTRGPLATVAQWYRYAFWRAHTMRRHPATIRPRQLVPPLALVAAALLVPSPARIVLPILALAFATLVVRGRERREPGLVTAASVLYFPCTHAAFACGLVAGLCAAFSRPWCRPSRVPAASPVLRAGAVPSRGPARPSPHG